MTVDEIIEPRCLNHKWSKIAALLGISRATLYRRLEESNISSDDHTQLSDHQLDELIRSIKQSHPNDGEVLMKGLLGWG